MQNVPGGSVMFQVDFRTKQKALSPEHVLGYHYNITITGVGPMALYPHHYYRLPYGYSTVAGFGVKANRANHPAVIVITKLKSEGSVSHLYYYIYTCLSYVCMLYVV